MAELRFDWTEKKAADNERKHGVTFSEAKTVFDDPYVLLKPDLDHSVTEDRVQVVGLSKKFRVLFVVFVERHDDLFRIISARKATRSEAAAYERRKAHAQDR